MLAEPQWAQIFVAAKKRGARWDDNADVQAFKREVEAALDVHALNTSPVVVNETPVRDTQIGLTDDHFAWAASRLECAIAQIRAVDEVESNGKGDSVLFEAHHFDKRTKGRFRESHPNLSSLRWNRKLYVGGKGEWARLRKAMQLDREAALNSASFGRYQIMGFNHALAGFETVEAFYAAMQESEARQLEAFVTFIEKAHMADKLRSISNLHASCIPFARAYNGPGYAKHEPGYHIRLARAHKKWAAR